MISMLALDSPVVVFFQNINKGKQQDKITKLPPKKNK
tara:strand:+ start:1333 stop:1443 length:111 start_codon:yes stop_codon:yes gene_type:complete